MMFGRDHQQTTAVDPYSSWVSAGMLSLAVHGAALTVIGTIDWPERHRFIEEIGATEDVVYFDVFIPETAPPSAGASPAEAGRAATIRHEATASFESPAVRIIEGPATTASLEEPVPAAHPGPLPDDLAPIASPAHGQSVFTIPRVLFPTGPRDPRLRVGGPPGLVPGTPSDILADRLSAMIGAVPDSMAAQLRKEETMGFSRLNGQLILRGGKLIMPTNGRLWETAQMMVYAEVAVRDSIRAERVRIMRERADDARAEQQSQRR